MRRFGRIIAALAVFELTAGVVSLPLVGGAVSRVRGVDGWIAASTGAGYFSFRNPTSRPLQIDAVTSPVATTAVLHHGPLVAGGSKGGIAHLFCGDPPADPVEGTISADFDTMPLTVPPHSQVTIGPGHGWLELAGLHSQGRRRGARVPVRLYLDSDEQVSLELAVR